MKLVLLSLPFESRDGFGTVHSGRLEIGLTDGNSFYMSSGDEPPVGTTIYVVEAQRLQVIKDTVVVPDAPA